MDIGRMFMVGFRGQEVEADDWIFQAIAEYHIGSVILFARNMDGGVQNISSPEQLQRLTGQLRAAAGSRPLLISVDQEGGRVCRLRAGDGFPATMSASELAGLADAEVRAEAARMARTLAEMGINWNLAPVVDLDLNPDNPIIGRYGRSFAAEPDRVVHLARLFIQAHHQAGIACCLKHFPGHGSAGQDSHKGFVDVTDCWQKHELTPFARLIDEGYVDAVMTGHLINRRLDPAGLPATLSRPVLHGLLREELGFDEVIVSDDLQMGAITRRWGLVEAVRMAVLAGVDLLTIGNNLASGEDDVLLAIRTVENMLDRGEVDADYIRAAIGRIITLQEKISGARSWNRSNSSRPTASR